MKKGKEGDIGALASWESVSCQSKVLRFCLVPGCWVQLSVRSGRKQALGPRTKAAPAGT